MFKGPKKLSTGTVRCLVSLVLCHPPKLCHSTRSPKTTKTRFTRFHSSGQVTSSVVPIVVHQAPCAIARHENRPSSRIHFRGGRCPNDSALGAEKHDSFRLGSQRAEVSELKNPKTQVEVVPWRPRKPLKGPCAHQASDLTHARSSQGLVLDFLKTPPGPPVQ